MGPILLILAAGAAANSPAQVPNVPIAAQIIAEDDHYSIRSFDSAKPLYTYDKDGPSQSNCVDRCATAWLPLPAARGSHQIGMWTPITRADGSLQWAWNGKPVYTFARDHDSKATGDGMGGVWHLLPTIPK